MSRKRKHWDFSVYSNENSSWFRNRSVIARSKTTVVKPACGTQIGELSDCFSSKPRLSRDSRCISLFAFDCRKMHLKQLQKTLSAKKSQDQNLRVNWFDCFQRRPLFESSHSASQLSNSTTEQSCISYLSTHMRMSSIACFTLRSFPVIVFLTMIIHESEKNRVCVTLFHGQVIQCMACRSVCR